MPLDYGSARPRRSPAQTAVVAAAAMTGLGFTGWLVGGAYLKHRQEALGLRSSWTLRGAPCPALTRAEFETRRLTAPKSFRYGAAVFHRRFGHAQCTELRRGGGWSTTTDPACQFTSPGALRVTTAKGDWYFAPGPGRPATIYTPDGVARCVLASNFTLGSSR